MPGIADALSVDKKRTGGTAPLVAALLTKMDEDLRPLAEQLIASEHSDRFVSEAFTDDGYPVSSGAIRNHRQTHKLSRFAR